MSPRLLLVPTLALMAAALSAAETPAVVTAEGSLTVEGEQTAVPATTGTKTDTPPLLQPQSVGTVDATLMREQHAVKLEDAIRNVAGVTVGGYYSDWDYYRIRGFDASATTRLDGLTATPGIWMNEEVYGLERIEVLKGPASMLYGQSVLGGMVNMVSKQPIRDDFATARVSAGSYNFAELGVDAGTTFSDEHIGVRLVAMGRNRGSHVDGVDDSQRFYVAPSLTWWAREHTRLTVLANYVEDDVNAAWPLPASGFITPNVNGSLPLSRNIGEPGTQNHVVRSRASIGYELDHQLSDALTLRQRARVSDYDSGFIGIYAGSLDPDGRTLNRDVYAYDSTRLDAQIDTMIEARFATGSVTHTTLVGVDLNRNTEEAFGQFGAIAPLDIFDPVYGATPGPLSPYTDNETKATSVGVYLQDEATIAEVITLTGGLRYDRIDTEKTEYLTSSTTDDDDAALTWRVGAAWAFHEEASVFASYSTAFTPQPYSRTVAGDRVDPETGNQIEIGLRYQTLDDRMNGTIALYRIERQDVATADLANPGFAVITGEQRSQGVDIDGTWKPLPGLSLIGTYAFINAEVTEDNSLPVGDRLRNVPRHSITSWIRYTLQNGVLRGLGVGAGVRGYSGQAGDLPNTFYLPKYAVVDAALYYDRGAFSAQFNVLNLLDEEYAVGSYNDLYVLPGDPLTVRGTLAYTF